MTRTVNGSISRIVKTGIIATAAALAMATSALASGLSATAQGKLVDAGSNWAEAFATPDARVPVIIDFRMPALPDGASFASDADRDEAHKAAVRAEQDRILSGVLGGIEGISSAQSSSEANLKLMPFSPQFGLHATAAQLEAIAADRQVVRIHEDRVSAPLLNQSLGIVQMPTAYTSGATGNGWRVAVLDTGGRRTHEFLSTSISHAACFSTTGTGGGYQSFSLCPGGAASSTDINSANDCDIATINGCGHGTHVAGTAAGFNTSPSSGEPANGVARDAQILSINVFSRFTPASCTAANYPALSNGCALTWNTDQISALNYVYGVRHTQRIAAVNMSLGGGQYSVACNDESRRPIIQALRNSGVATVISAGNEGYDAAVGAPACIPEAVTVAASTKSTTISNFTNWGNLVDVVAPGVAINAPYLSGSSNTYYAALNGTSMAAPHVAGAFAAIRTRLPGATVDQIENALKATGAAITYDGVTRRDIRVASALTNLGVTATPGTTIVAAVTPVARRGQINSDLTAFATIINAGSSTATNCAIARPAGGQPYDFTFYPRPTPSTLGAANQPVNIAAGGQADFLMTFKPTAAMSANLLMIFYCSNTEPAPTYLGVNSFNLIGTAAAGPDLIAVAATPTGDGILNVPLNGGAAMASAAINIGPAGTVRARVSTGPVGGSEVSLPLTVLLCRTNTSGVCVEPTTPTASPFNFTATANGTVTFSAFVNHNGAAIPFDPAARRLYFHFEQQVGATFTPVGSASVAVRTQTSTPPASTETAALTD